VPQAPWVWTDAGVVLDRERDGTRERLWISPSLPRDSERASHPLHVELLCWFADTAKVNVGLQIVRDSFRHDTILAAVRRTDDTTRLTLYTGAREAVVHERYFAVRAVLRPTAIGLRITSDANWAALRALLGYQSIRAATG
jgi:hypothetical protein